MVVARSHVQMMVYRYRGHQYHYSGHCVSFMQNNVKTVDTLPNLPSELDVVVLRPSDRVASGDQRYGRQFRTDFRVRRGPVVAWLRFLKAHHPDYRHVTISAERIAALPLDGDVSSSFPAVVDDTCAQGSPAQDTPAPAPPFADDLPPPASHSMVPNLDVTATEADQILDEICNKDPVPSGVPAPSIRQTPLDEASGADGIFAMAFPTLYPTGRAEFNASRPRAVSLDDYAQPLLRFHDGRFGSHRRWRFFVFNII